MERFLAREDEQDRFVSVLQHLLGEKDGPDEGYLMVVQGHGGIGKTELLRRFGGIVRREVRRPGLSQRFYLVSVDWSVERQNRPTDYASWAGPPVWVALDALYVNLRDEVSGWRARRRFERAFASYREQAAKVKAVQTAEAEPSNLPDIVGAAISLIGGLAPLPGAAAASGSAAKLAVGLTQGAQSLRGRVDDKKYDLVIGSDDALIRSFASGVKAISRRRPIVFILDTAEILGEARDRIRQVVKRSGARTVWVLGIRLEDEAHAAEDSETTLLRRNVDNARLRLVPLSRFDDRTIERYLRTRLSGMPVTEELPRAVVSLTRGIPLAVHLTATLLNRGVPPSVALQEVSATGEVSEIISGLARRYLVHLTETSNPEMRTDLKLIYGLALLSGPTSDPDLLGALWGIPATEVAERMDGLVRRHDFVLSGQRRLHHEVRRTIRLFLLDPARRVEVRAANERAIAALRARISDLNLTTVEAQLADEEWRAAAVHLLWHTFWVSNRDGLRLLAELVPAAHTLAQPMAAELLQTAEWFAPVLTVEQRTVLAGTRLLLPSSPFLNRLQAEFRRAAERLNKPVDDAALDVITEAAGTAGSILASDVPPIVFVLLLKLHAPVDNDDQRPAAVLEQMVAFLPATGMRRLRQIVAARAEALTRNLVGRSDVKNVAVGVSRIAVQLAPTNAAMHCFVATACQSIGDFTGALEAAGEACRLEPHNAEWHVTRGVILRDLARNEECLAAYEEACRLQPENPQWHINRGIALHRLGRNEDALAAYEEVRRLQPDDAGSHNNCGIALGRLGRYEEALAAYEEASRLQPDNPQWHTGCGMALGRLGRYEDALAAYEETCRLEPDDPAWHNNRGITLGRLGRYEEALAAIEEGLRVTPDAAYLLNNRAQLLALLGRDADAVEIFRRSIDMSAGNRLEPSVLLAVLLHRAQAGEAAELCEAALGMSGEEVTDFQRGELRAFAYVILGRPDEAETELREAFVHWVAVDAFQPELYSLLRVATLADDAERLLRIWRESGRLLSGMEEAVA